MEDERKMKDDERRLQAMKHCFLDLGGGRARQAEYAGVRTKTSNRELYDFAFEFASMERECPY